MSSRDLIPAVSGESLSETYRQQANVCHCEPLTAQFVRTTLLDKCWKRSLPIPGALSLCELAFACGGSQRTVLRVERCRLQLKQPSVRANEKTVYMRQPASVEKSTRPNLEKPASEFFGEGSTLAVTDPTLPYPPYLLLQISVE
eukprot:COSAG02_NODE_3320_length_6947_cov_4.871349_4_plen_144_part_00